MAEVSGQQVIMVSSDLAARREIAAQILEDRKNGVELDRAKRPGGYFLGADGTPHDAHGNPVEPIAEDDAAAAQAKADAADAAAKDADAAALKAKAKK